MGCNKLSDWLSPGVYMERLNDFANGLANRMKKQKAARNEMKMTKGIVLLNAQLKAVFLIQFVNLIIYFCF